MTLESVVIEPAENAELLRAGARLLSVRRRTDPGLWIERKRELILCLESHRLLVAMDGEQPRVLPGPAGRMLLAFTDDDAAQAWAESRHPADDVEARFAPNTDAASPSEREGRTWWLDWLNCLDADQIRVNPVGPLGYTVFRNELAGTRRGLRRRRRGTDSDSDDLLWLDVDDRAAERQRVSAKRAEILAAVQAGDEARLKEMDPRSLDLNRLGNGLWSAEDRLLDARRHLQRGDALRGAREHMLAAIGFGQFGDPFSAVDALLETGALLLDMHARQVTDPDAPDFVRRFLGETADALAKLRMGYRDADIDALLAQIDAAR